VSLTKTSFHYKRLYPALKWIFSGLSLYFFIRQVQNLEGNVLSQIITKLSQTPLALTILILLALVNWNAEAQKFKLLIKSEIQLSNVRALFTILGGMAISNFTPARTGDYIGRGLLLKKVHPLKVVVATVVGNIAQVLMTYCLGLMCLIAVVFWGDYDALWHQFQKKEWVISLIIVFILLIIFTKPLLNVLKPKLPKALGKGLKLIRKYDQLTFSRLLGIAFVRYVAFAMQFFLLLNVFASQALPLHTLALVPVAYLMQSVAPVPAISDIGVRVFVTTQLFHAFLIDSAILQAVTCLWFLNLILPGLVGTIYLLISTIRQKWFTI
jgi:hypothetical protein